MKIQKKIVGGRFGGGGCSGWGCESGCERRIEVFVKIKKNIVGGVGVGGQGGCE